ncbi:MAG TPA: tRNA uridine-5-carboxymethylaminomethyl(34) synthesis GTPase MnmE [Candidatus Paraprevotella stercorigallinarum]|nr:tRNA uridine-5-carboxymethylaminomethyl(34) synthesis GTPase MnmE [Candidatus Paraprevotella stercorigallinarum]
MYLLNEDTICAPATVPGTGAISVVRVSGPEALHAVSAIVKCAGGRDVASAPGYSVRYGHVFMQDGSLLDDVLVSVFRAPHSYTGEDSAEISCHASRYIVDNIMFMLAGQGIRAAAPGEFTRRAFLNGKMDLAQAEAVADLIAAENAAAHRVALNQLKGGFSKELKKMRDQLLNIVSLMELELDFSEEEVEFADRSELSGLVDGVIAHIGRLASSFRVGNAIKNGIPVAIAGATNTGKSTLLNTLAGEERAIVSDVHGTTRDTIEETLNVGGMVFRFIDTAGIRKTDETVEKIGIERTFKKLEEAAVVLVMLDLGRLQRLFSGHAAGDGDNVSGGEEGILSEQLLSDILDRVDASGQKVIFVLNKVDILKADAASGDFPSGGNSVSGGSSASGDFPPDDASVSGVGSDGRLPEYAENRAGEYGVLTGTFFRNGLSGKFTLPEMDNKNVSLLNKIISLINNQCVSRGIKDAALVFVSAREGEGTGSLKDALSCLCQEYAGVSDGVIITNLRHIEALENASAALQRVHSGLSSGLPTDLVSQDIREALYHLGSIVGEISTDEILGSIFSRFCIGK